jgi:hypothetical protein
MGIVETVARILFLEDQEKGHFPPGYVWSDVRYSEVQDYLDLAENITRSRPRDDWPTYVLNKLALMERIPQET